MIEGFYKDRNWEQLLAGIRAVEKRGAAETGMVLIDGAPGVGKTEAISRLVVNYNVLYVRVPSIVDKKGLMVLLAKTAPGVKETGTALSIQLELRQYIIENKCMLILDECQFLLRGRRDAALLEIVRDLTDATKCVCLLVAGENDVKQKIAKHAQIESRINRVIEFSSIDAAEMPKILKAKCSIPISDDLQKEFHRQSRGNWRALMKGIPALEAFAKNNGKSYLSLKDIVDDKGAAMRICADWKDDGRKRGA